MALSKPRTVSCSPERVKVFGLPALPLASQRLSRQLSSSFQVSATTCCGTVPASCRVHNRPPSVHSLFTSDSTTNCVFFLFELRKLALQRSIGDPASSRATPTVTRTGRDVTSTTVLGEIVMPRTAGGSPSFSHLPAAFPAGCPDKSPSRLTRSRATISQAVRFAIARVEVEFVGAQQISGFSYCPGSEQVAYCNLNLGVLPRQRSCPSDLTAHLDWHGQLVSSQSQVLGARAAVPLPLWHVLDDGRPPCVHSESVTGANVAPAPRTGNNSVWEGPR
mmetsp:Transcript_9760/g.27937  ORF Transcript_9760/g.27937 Transcript_9760/m.27937 type:complete len:277 (-) Transcript_9760:96-926(-)